MKQLSTDEVLSIVDSEEEFDGELPENLRVKLEHANTVDKIVDLLRASVRCTKKNISRRIIEAQQAKS